MLWNTLQSGQSWGQYEEGSFTITHTQTHKPTKDSDTYNPCGKKEKIVENWLQMGISEGSKMTMMDTAEDILNLD